MRYKVTYTCGQQYVNTNSDTVETEEEVKEYMRHHSHYGGSNLDLIVKIEPMYKYMVSVQCTDTYVGSLYATSEEDAKALVKKTAFKSIPFWETHDVVKGKRKHIQITKEEK